MVAFAAGLGLSVQFYVNGQLSRSLGSGIYAGLVNNLGGLLVLGVIACTLGIPGRVAERLRAEVADGTVRRLRWWHVLAGVNGGLFIAGTAAAAPEVGLALVTVAVVLGQLVGGAIVDRVGMNASRPLRITPARAAGIGLVLAASAIGLRGVGEIRLGVLAVVAALGVGSAVQQAAMGHVVERTGEPVVASALNLTVGAVGLAVIAAVTAGAQPPLGWNAPTLDWTGGLLAAATSGAMAAVVRKLGVLRLMLGMIAGQTLGALALDIAFPIADEKVTVFTFASLGLTVAAVYVSGQGERKCGGACGTRPKMPET